MTSHPLDGSEVVVLLAIHRHTLGGAGRRFTATALFEMLRREMGRHAPSESAVKKSIKKLSTREPKLIEGKAMPREAGHPGPAPLGFLIATDRIVTSPIDAWMLLELLHYPSIDGVEVEHFLNKITSQSLPNEEKQSRPSRKELQDRLERCGKLGYLGFEAKDANGAQDERGRLRPLDRINDEKRFLETISNWLPKKTATRERGRRPRLKTNRNRG